MRASAFLMLAVLFAGCSSDREDQAFFEQGWIKPEQGANRRMYGARQPGARETPAPTLPPTDAR